MKMKHKPIENKKNMKRRMTLMLGMAAMLASCSQDDALQNTVHHNEGLKPMTITASLPTGGMQSRAKGDADATRCYVQILDRNGKPLEGDNSVPIKMEKLDNGNFSTLVHLNGNETYDFLFWADTEADDAAAPADLKAVEYTNGQTIAWAGKINDNPWNADGVKVTLYHVVSRVTVMTESEFEVSDKWPFTVTVPTVYSEYNVADEKVVADSKVSIGYTFKAQNGEYKADTEVGHFYVLGDGRNQKLGLHYDGPLKNPAIEINEVPVSANTHITVKGNIYNAGLVDGYITAKVDVNWDPEVTEDFDGGSDQPFPGWGDGGHVGY